MENLKVMIVDDDKIVTDDLLHMIDWNRFGFDIVAVANNGKVGLIKYEQTKPHIIFTDIKMPFMDGLEMIKHIRQVDDDVSFVILSAYGEFEYAQQAITLGAHAYILKATLNEKNLLDELLPIREMILERIRMAYFSVYSLTSSCIDSEPVDLPSMLRNLENAFNYLLKGAEQPELPAITKQLSDLIHSAYREHGKQSFYENKTFINKDELYQWLCHQILLIRWWIEEEQKNEISKCTSKAMLYIEINYHNKNLNVKDIANASLSSVSWLSTCFKKETGYSLKEYIIKVRIDHAKELLRQGNNRVYEVADMVGFSSGQYFSKVFYKYTMQLPNQFRGDDE